MILIALIPPLWFFIMNKRIIEYEQKIEKFEKDNINLFPELEQ